MHIFYTDPSLGMIQLKSDLVASDYIQYVKLCNGVAGSATPIPGDGSGLYTQEKGSIYEQTVGALPNPTARVVAGYAGSPAAVKPFSLTSNGYPIVAGSVKTSDASPGSAVGGDYHVTIGGIRVDVLADYAAPTDANYDYTPLSLTSKGAAHVETGLPNPQINGAADFADTAIPVQGIRIDTLVGGGADTHYGPLLLDQYLRLAAQIVKVSGLVMYGDNGEKRAVVQRGNGQLSDGGGVILAAPASGKVRRILRLWMIASTDLSDCALKTNNDLIMLGDTGYPFSMQRGVPMVMHDEHGVFEYPDTDALSIEYSQASTLNFQVTYIDIDA